MNTFSHPFTGFSCCVCYLCLLVGGRAAELPSVQLVGGHPEGTTPEHNNISGTAGAIPALEAAFHGFPALLDLQGKKLADGEFTQWLENDLLHVTIAYDFGAGHRVEEKSVFRQNPRLVQENWVWSETRSGEMLRHFEVDFKSGKAVADKREGKEVKRRAANVKVEPGRTFAGFGFVLALKSLRERLVKGEKVEVQAVGFTPKPRVVSVDLSCGGVDQMNMEGHTVNGDRFVIHPKIPMIAKAFVEVKDTHIWLTASSPPSFLRWEGPLVEANDPLVRVDFPPEQQGRPAQPAVKDEK